VKPKNGLNCILFSQNERRKRVRKKPLEKEENTKHTWVGLGIEMAPCQTESTRGSKAPAGKLKGRGVVENRILRERKTDNLKGSE